jgi:GNAT superfamily N-acetyltransferase
MRGVPALLEGITMSVPDADLELRWTPDAAFLAPIGQGLGDFNDTAVGKVRKRWFALRAQSPEGRVTGGLYGWVMGGWLYVDWLWVAEGARGQDLGTRLLQSAESLARAEGMVYARLETASWQALPFYRKQGYKVFAELPIDTPDSPGTFSHREYFLKKTL